jgi:hypothetical protein
MPVPQNHSERVGGWRLGPEKQEAAGHLAGSLSSDGATLWQGGKCNCGPRD